MRKKSKGKQRLAVIRNKVYSNLIFQVSGEKNYAQKIFEIYGKKKSASVISRQLDILETEEHFLKSEIKEDKNVFPMQKLRVYSVNWQKIIGEFIKEIKKQKEAILEQDKNLNSNLKEIFGSRMDLLSDLDNEEFIERLKKNSYLIEYLKIYFGKISRISLNYTISEVLGYILFFADFDFLHSTNMNFNKVLYYLEQQKKGEIPENVEGISEKEWKEIDNKQWKAHFKESAKKLSGDYKTALDKAQERTNKIAREDKELTELAILNNIFQILKVELTLQVSLNQTLEEVSELIIKKHLTKEEFLKLEQFDFINKRPKTPQNSSETTKPEEKISNKSGNTTQNIRNSNEEVV